MQMADEKKVYMINVICNLFQNKIILSNSRHSEHLASFYSLDMPQKTPNNDCPIPVAYLDHIGVLFGVKKSIIGCLLESIGKNRPDMAIFWYF